MAPKRTSKTNLEKREVIEWIKAEGGGVPTRAVKHFQAELGWKVSVAQIRYWWKHREAIPNASAMQLRLPSGGARPQLGEVEDILFDQILYLRSAKEKVSRQWIQSTALDLARTDTDVTDFVASDKWLARFMARYGLSLRRTTNLTVLSDDELTDRAVRFMTYLASKKPALNPNCTVLMDETAVYFEDPRRDTVDITGARHVVLRSTGFASMRVTVALTVTAAGHKLPPLIIWKGGKGKGDRIQKHGPVYVAYHERAWVNSQLLEQWIDLMFPAVLDSIGGRGLIWDSMRAHISKAVNVTGLHGGCCPKVVPLYKPSKYGHIRQGTTRCALG